MALSPRPISLTSGTNPDPAYTPEPVVVVGGLPAPAAATASVRGGVLRAPAQANSTATDVAGLVADFNALLLKLRNAGVIAP